MIIELQFSDIKQIFTYMVESIMEISQLKNPKINLMIEFWLLQNSLLHVYPIELKRVLNKYNGSANRLNEPKLLKKMQEHISILANNIIRQEKVMSVYFTSLDDDRVPVKTRINDIYSNICIYLLYLDFKDSDLNECLDCIFRIDINNNIIVPNSYNYLVELYNIKQNKINQSNTDKFLEIYNKYHYAMDDIDQFSECFISIDEINRIDYAELALDDLFDLWIHRKNDIDIEVVKDQYELKLKKHFSMEYFRLGVITGIIDYARFLDPAISKLENAIKKDGYSFKWEFLKFIEVAYYADIDLSGEKFKFLHEIQNDYYNWLLNLESFDYERFEPYWLLEWGALAYFNKFKTITKIKTKVEEYLAKNDHPTMSRIYFNFFCK